MKKSTAVISMVFTFLAGCALTLCIFYSIPRTDSASLRKAREVYGMLDKYFIGELDEEALSDTVAGAMVYAAGDRWSYYIPASELAAHMEQINNAYVGIGISLLQQDEALLISQVVPGGPAAQAGILAGDELIAVDAHPCAELTLDELRTLVRGEVGTTVTVTVQRNGEQRDLPVIRNTLQTEIVRTRLLGCVGYISILNFEQNSAEQVISAIEKLRAQGATMLAFDVRNNPGGLKDELVTLLDYLLPEGILFRSEDYAGRESIDRSDAACLDLPMVVLMNQDSYSAAEFFAAALSEYGVAKTVGAQTCGKGYYQITAPLSDGSALNLSVGKYVTPKGVSLAEVGGLTPDYPVELPEQASFDLLSKQLSPAEDPQLQKALDVLGEAAD